MVDPRNYVLATLVHPLKETRIFFFKASNLDEIEAGLKKFTDDGYEINQATGFPFTSTDQIALAKEIIKLIGKDNSLYPDFQDFFEKRCLAIFNLGVSHIIKCDTKDDVAKDLLAETITNLVYEETKPIEVILKTVYENPDTISLVQKTLEMFMLRSFNHGLQYGFKILNDTGPGPNNSKIN